MVLVGVLFLVLIVLSLFLFFRQEKKGGVSRNVDQEYDCLSYISAEYLEIHGEEESQYCSDLDGDGTKEWLEISGPTGSGGFIGYSLFKVINGKPVAIFFGEGLYQGQVSLVDGGIETTVGYPRKEDPNCCPSRQLKKRYVLEDGLVRLESSREKDLFYP